MAGYLHVTPGEPPNRLFDLALAEPERTLRAEVLKQAEVRRPDVRGLLAWFEARDAFSATIVMDDDGPVGFILLPARGTHGAADAGRSARRARARRSHQLAAHASRRRCRARASAKPAPRSGSGRSKRIASASNERSKAAPARHRAVAERLAQKRARLGLRAGVAHRARRARARRPNGLGNRPRHAARRGSDGLCGARAPRERTSRRTVRECGLHAARRARARALERPRTIAGTARRRRHAALARRQRAAARGSRARGEDTRRATSRQRGVARPPGLVVSTHAVDRNARRARQDRARAASRDRAPKSTLPALLDRAEDLRALVLSALARESTRVGREPLGIDAGALRLLVEHTWPGNELELEAVLLRAVRVAREKLVTAEDLAKVGFEVKGPASRVPRAVHAGAAAEHSSPGTATLGARQVGPSANVPFGPRALAEPMPSRAVRVRTRNDARRFRWPCQRTQARRPLRRRARSRPRRRRRRVPRIRPPNAAHRRAQGRRGGGGRRARGRGAPAARGAAAREPRPSGHRQDGRVRHARGHGQTVRGHGVAGRRGPRARASGAIP